MYSLYYYITVLGIYLFIILIYFTNKVMLYFYPKILKSIPILHSSPYVSIATFLVYSLF